MTESDDQARARRRKLRRLLASAVVMLLIVSAGAGWFLIEQRRALDAPLVVPRGGFDYVLPAGASLNQVAQDLAASGLLANPRSLVTYARWHGRAGGIKAGEYRIETGTTAITLLDQLIAGRVVQHTLTLVEGWTFKQTMAAIAADDRLEHTLTGLAEDAIMARLGLPDQHPEASGHYVGFVWCRGRAFF